MKLYTILICASALCVAETYASVRGSESALKIGFDKIAKSLLVKRSLNDFHAVIITNLMTDRNGNGMTINIDSYLHDRAKTAQKGAPQGKQGKYGVQNLAYNSSVIVLLPKDMERSGTLAWGLYPSIRYGKDTWPIWENSTFMHGTTDKVPHLTPGHSNILYLEDVSVPGAKYDIVRFSTDTCEIANPTHCYAKKAVNA